MGCVHSKKDLSDINPNIYRVINIDGEGVSLWSGKLEISSKELILYRKGREPTRWPLQHLRRYGFDSDVFSFEVGRRCITGEGIYAFRCRRANSLFHLLQTYIQGIAINEDGIAQMNEILSGSVNSRASQQSQNSPRPNSLIQNPGANVSYVIPNGRIQITNNLMQQTNSAHNDTFESNYLEPLPISCNDTVPPSPGTRLRSTSSVPLSPELTNSPSSILNIDEIITSNQQQLYENNIICSEANLCHNKESNNNLLCKVLQDKPPLEPAPSIASLLQENRKQSLPNSNKEIIWSKKTNTDSDIEHDRPYVNIAPGKLEGILKCCRTNSNKCLAEATMNLNLGDSAARFYENLDLTECKNLFKYKRFSKPELFSKIDISNTAVLSIDRSEPSSPTIFNKNRKVNYIVLDLDQSALCSSPTPSSSSANVIALSKIAFDNTINNENAETSLKDTNSISNCSKANCVSKSATFSGSNILIPGSPKLSTQGYATIDFNKTIALLNSTSPSSEIDNEELRKTRHSSTAIRHTNSISD